MSMFARSLKALTIEKKKCVDMAELKKTQMYTNLYNFLKTS